MPETTETLSSRTGRWFHRSADPAGLRTHRRRVGPSSSPSPWSRSHGALPRFDPAKPAPTPEWVTDAVDSATLRTVLAALALAAAGWVALAAIWGPQNKDNAYRGRSRRPTVGGVGRGVGGCRPIWRVISPVRTLWRLLPTGRGDRSGGHRYPTPVPHHPGILAGAGLVGVRVAGTGKSDPGSLSAIKIWILCYLVAMFASAAVFRARWFARADPFEVYSVTVSPAGTVSA